MISSIKSMECSNPVSFGKKEHKAHESDKKQNHNSNLATGAKILGALAITGGAIWGVVNLAKKGKAAKAAEAAKDIKYYGTYENLKAVNKKEVEEANALVNDFLESKARTKKRVHNQIQKELKNVDWDAKPMTKAEILAEQGK